MSKIGNSSVRYELTVFRMGSDIAIASGHFVHVFVERATNMPVSVPDQICAALKLLMDTE